MSQNEIIVLNPVPELALVLAQGFVPKSCPNTKVPICPLCVLENVCMSRYVHCVSLIMRLYVFLVNVSVCPHMFSVVLYMSQYFCVSP